jgi:hypothetical protein
MKAEGQLDALTLGSRAVQILRHEENRSVRWCHGGESTRLELAPERKATSSSSLDNFGAAAAPGEQEQSKRRRPPGRGQHDCSRATGQSDRCRTRTTAHRLAAETGG